MTLLLTTIEAVAMETRLPTLMIIVLVVPTAVSSGAGYRYPTHLHAPPPSNHPTPPKLINSYVVSMDAMSIQDRLVAVTEVQFPDDYNAWTWLLDLVSSAKPTACIEQEQSPGAV